MSVKPGITARTLVRAARLYPTNATAAIALFESVAEDMVVDDGTGDGEEPSVSNPNPDLLGEAKAALDSGNVQDAIDKLTAYQENDTDPSTGEPAQNPPGTPSTMSTASVNKIIDIATRLTKKGHNDLAAKTLAKLIR